MMTSLTSSGAILAATMGPRIATDPNSGAGIVENDPRKLPMGVRTADKTYTALLISMVLRCEFNRCWMELAKKSKFWHGDWIDVGVSILSNWHQMNLV